MLKRYREDEILGKPLSARQKEELHALEAASDKNIDTSDIPASELPVGAVRGKHFQPFPGPVNVKEIRARSGLSQAEFAKRYGFNVRTFAGLGRKRNAAAEPGARLPDRYRSFPGDGRKGAQGRRVREVLSPAPP
jgi:hypothetical protein